MTDGGCRPSLSMKPLLRVLPWLLLAAVPFTIAMFVGMGEQTYQIVVRNEGDRTAQLATRYDAPRGGGVWTRWNVEGTEPASGRKRSGFFYGDRGRGDLYQIGVADEWSDSYQAMVTFSSSELEGGVPEIVLRRGPAGWTIRKATPKLPR